jgi:PAS domain S-box-containing protein
LLLFDAAGALTYANPAARKSLLEVYEPAQLFASLIEPRSERPLATERTPLARALRGDSTEAAQFMLRRQREANPQWYECDAHPLISPVGEIRGAIVAFRNITERRRKELATESANQLRDFIYNENLAGIIHSSFDGRILDCNQALLAMFGYDSKQELMALRAAQLYYDPAERDRLLAEIKRHGQLSKYETCFRRKDGSRCWALLNVRLLEAPLGEVGGTVVSTVIDITERRQSEETLRQSEQRFSAFMRHLPGVAFIKDLSGRYVYYNEGSLQQFRKTPDEIVGRTDEELWPAEDAARYRANDAAVTEGHRPLEFIEPVAHSDGVHSWLMYKFPIVEEGKVTLVGGIGIDVTERTILEEQLTQARKMEALGRLAGGVAHDFNNLLTVISGYGQLALEGAGSASTERMILWLQEILNSSRRAAGLTNQLLAFSRRQAIEPTVLDLSELLRNMQRLLQRVIGEHVDLKIRCGSEPCHIRADVNQIEQVVMNLAVNSRDAMPLGGSLEIGCESLKEQLPVAPGDDGDGPPLTVLLEVRDSGVGMDDTIRPQIFDPFFTSKEKGKGTGLGLSTVYGIVSQARGKILVESAPGEGTVFRIYFPAADGAVEKTTSGRHGATPRGSETVLVVEDEASVRTLAETILARLGYRVVVADSGQAALKMWEQLHGRIDVLLTDVIMPHMSGGDLAHALRERKPALKVLFMSGYTDDMLAGHGVLARETQLIQKPFTAEMLGKKLRDVLDA